MSDANKTQLLTTDPNRTQLGVPPTADPNKTVMGTAPTLNATITIKPTQCPICKTFNPAGVMFCIDCGLIFDKALPADAFGAPAIQLPVLVDGSGREHPIRPGLTTMGREGDIMISDGRVSRRHAQITSEDNVLTLEDLGSTNGTKLNGQPVALGERRSLNAGDTVSLGGVEMKLSLPGASNATAVLSSNKTAAMTAAPKQEVPPATLVGDGHEFPLRKGVNTFGRRSADNDIAVQDPYVSGKHGIIEVTEDGVFLTDIGSSNGTMLNDAKLAPNMRTSVTPEDVIRLGSLEFQVRVNPDAI
jgi:pSer/pThr/pTyr-binding forkhead associated (FHA) protein